MDEKKNDSTVMDNNERMRENKRWDEVSQGGRWQRDVERRGRDGAHNEKEEEKKRGRKKFMRKRAEE
jgi:hypothetical protein